MGKCPEYLKKKRKSYKFWFFVALALLFVFWKFYSVNEWENLETSSVLANKNFKGEVKEIIAPVSNIKAYFMKLEDTPLIVTSFVFEKTGSAYDEKAKEGIANLAAETMLYGNARLSAEKLRDELGVKGIKINFRADKDNIEGVISSPKANFVEGAKILADILKNPKFEKKYLDIAKDKVVKILETEKENPNRQLNLEFVNKIYKRHPYGRNLLGEKQSVLNLTQGDLRRFVASRFAKDNLKIGIVGNIEKEEAADLIDLMFSKLQEKTQVNDLEYPVIDWTDTPLQIKRESGQNVFLAVAKSTCRTCEDFYPLYIANYLFGGSGLNSRMNKEMREKEGLTYGGFSSMTLSDKNNMIFAGFSSTPDKFEKAKNIFMNEWVKIGKSGFEENELEQAKSYLISSHNLRYAATADIAVILAYMQKENLGLDFLVKRNKYVENVTLTKLNEVAKKYFGNEILQSEIGTFN